MLNSKYFPFMRLLPTTEYLVTDQQTDIQTDRHLVKTLEVSVIKLILVLGNLHQRVEFGQFINLVINFKFITC